MKSNGISSNFAHIDQLERDQLKWPRFDCEDNEKVCRTDESDGILIITDDEIEVIF